MKRIPLVFGADAHLIGILHLPDVAGDTGVVIWNTGISNRVGPFRLAVDIADTFPELPVLRFDLSTLGDSDARNSTAPALERNSLDVIDAMNYLEQHYGLKRFILMGICSGAVDAHVTAVADARVIGLAMVDGYVYRTPRFYVHFYMRRLFVPRRVFGFLARKIQKLFKAPEPQIQDNFEGIYPDERDIGDQVQRLVDRGVEMYVAFTGGFEYLYSYRQQFLDMLPRVRFGEQLELEHFPAVDHLFTLSEHRTLILNRLRGWMNHKFLSPLAIKASAPVDLVSLLRPHWSSSAAREAIVDDGSVIDYQALERASRALAQHLQQQGIGRGDLVGVCMSRSPQMIVAVLGVLRAGAAYAPLDPAYPQDRLDYMMDVAAIKTLLLSSDLEARFRHFTGQSLVLDDFKGTPEENWQEPSLQAHDLAYVIFTSGSTGKPKGVAMGHGALTQLILWQDKTLPLPHHRTLQFAPLSFDVSFQEIFSTLVAGGSLYIIRDDQRLNPYELLTRLAEQKIQRLYLPFVALQLLAEMAQVLDIYPASLVDVITAGEQLKASAEIRHFFKRLPTCTLHNHYGPSETHVITAYTLDTDTDRWQALPSIGQAIEGSAVYLLDADQKPVPAGETGELYLAGLCLAEGYIHRPDLTAEKFIELDKPGLAHRRFYRTGDLGRVMPDGNLEFLGRIDAQVKIRGYRIELGEIEVQLEAHPAIAQAIVQAFDTASGEKTLVAFIVTKAPGFDAEACRLALASQLPDYMVPAHFEMVDELPRTPSGKVDRRALPAPKSLQAATVPPPALAASASLAPAPRPASSSAAGISLEGVLQLFRELLKHDAIEADDNFFQKGGTSILAMKAVALLKQRHGIDLAITQFFERSSATALMSMFNQQPSAGAPAPRRQAPPVRTVAAAAGQRDIAIIGMAGYFPGAVDTSELWERLLHSYDGTVAIKEEELHPSVPHSLRQDPNYVRRRGMIAGADGFDPAFFRMTPRDAELLDPQQRLFLELAWHALDDAGITAMIRGSQTGVFAGTAHNSYYVESVLKNSEVMRKVGSFQAMLMNDKDYVATRLAYFLNLKGPALSIHTACSTSLVALINAVDSLRAGRCEIAIAGGVAVQAPQKAGYLYQEGAIYARDGVCRPFSADATGTFFSDGGGVVILKPLAAAKADGDRILAVIKGVGLNNDGQDKASFSAPSVGGQAACLSLALEDGAIDPHTVSYVECHGTATPIGDPIEVEALAQAYRISERKNSGKAEPCLIGSIKSNFGHLTAAAGVVGLIKTVMALKHRTLPASAHFSTPNPLINFHDGALQVVARPQNWVSSGLRRAGVSSFGFGGTNAHVILEEAPVTVTPAAAAGLSPQLYLSATHADGLKILARAWAEKIQREPELDLVAAGMSSQVGRQHFAHRTTVTAVTRDALLKQLEDWRDEKGRELKGTAPALALVFPGQGSQYLGMGADLWQSLPPFRAALERLLLLAEKLKAPPLRSLLLAQNGEAADLKQTRVTQPALFVIELALAQTLEGFGLTPAFYIGHSVGEIVAATLSGVFTEEEALGLVIARGDLMQKLPSGGMLSVRTSIDKVRALLPDTLDIAAINSPDLCVIAGPDAELEKWSQVLTAQHIAHQALHTSHAFHSRMMEPAIAPLLEKLQSYRLRAPQRPIISSVSGRILSPEEARDPHYWASHLRQTVNFAEAIREAWKQPAVVLLECGPRQTCTTLALKQIKDRQRQTAIATLSDRSGEGQELKALQEGLAKLWQSGLEGDARLFWQHFPHARVSTPNFPFQKKKLWIEPDTAAASAPSREILPAIPYQTEVKPMSSSTVDHIRPEVYALLEEASGIEIEAGQEHLSFLELGFDSLFLTQVAISLQNTFKVSITFRQLMEDVTTLETLLNYLATHMTAEQKQAYASTATGGNPMPAAQLAPSYAAASYGAPSAPLPQAPAQVWYPGPAQGPVSGDRQQIVARQLQLMEQQLFFLGAGGAIPGAGGGGLPLPQPHHQSSQDMAPAPAAPLPVQTASTAVTAVAGHAPKREGGDDTAEEKELKSKAFGAIARIQKTSESMTDLQRRTLAEFTAMYTQKTKKSKDYTQTHRRHMADPRVVTGFKPALKELVYPLIIERSSGCQLWDLDGNVYIDMLCGFGSNYLGYQADVILKALQEQLKRGMELGPQQALVGEASRMVCELTGFDRAAWCNTGSEAVLGAIRIARTVTGRSQIASFNGSYHGINDEVIVRGTKKHRPVASAPGILPNAVQNMLVLDYGTEESLRIIREKAPQLAAILVEPVQSRRPEFRPVEFLKELRKISREAGCLLIFDEVITGFRYSPGGVQSAFGIQADLGTYGKVVGGGMPIGMIAGARPYMDALDGGFWSFGDSSIPEVGVTYFAGTFVRHPLAIAAAHATLTFLKEQGPSLQAGINQRADHLCQELNGIFQRYGTPYDYCNFGSLMKLKTKDESLPYQELLGCWLRSKGIHIIDGFPTFLTAAHQDEHIEKIIHAFKSSIEEMGAGGLLDKDGKGLATVTAAQQYFADQGLKDKPKVKGARLGRDSDGNPAWFVEDEQHPGQYLMIG